MQIKTYGKLLTKADINARDEHKNSALFYAIRNKNMSLVKELLTLGADVNLECEGDNTALHEAVKQREAKMVKLLVQRGANILKKNSLD